MSKVVKIGFGMAVALLSVFASSQAYAYRPGYINGPGLLKCGEYLSYRGNKDKSAEIAISSWVQGYIGGYNIYATAAQVNPPDNLTILAYIDKYCKDNPLLEVNNSTIALINELGGTAHK